MRRPGNRHTYDKLLARIRSTVPDVTLRTTLIVGFPGETEADFAQLEGFTQAVGFDHVGVFPYSHEEGTSAHQLPDDVGARTKRARQGRLMTRQKRIVENAQKARVGRTVRLLVDGPAEHDLVLRGRLEGQAPDIDPLVYLTECDPTRFSAGQFIDAEIVGSRGYDLLARPLDNERP
jgi:ribosomal protein S12 methylthiotransferase